MGLLIRFATTIVTALHIRQGKEERTRRSATTTATETTTTMRLRRTMWMLEEHLVSEMIFPPSVLTPRRNWWPTPMTVTHFTTVTNSRPRSRAVETSCSTTSE